MSYTQIHDIDPDGDTLLILKHSDIPFAACDTDECWPNALPQYHSKKSKQQEGSILSVELTDIVDSGLSGISSLFEDELVSTHTRYKLCSHILRRTCSYFARLMCRKWQEAEYEPGFQWTITATDWDDKAVLILMNILYHRTRLIPREISLEILAKITVLVDYYGCHEAVELWTETWMAKIGSHVPNYYCRDLLLRLTVAKVFSDNKSFSLLTRVAIYRSRGPIHTLGLPIPQQIVDVIEKKRKEGITQILEDIKSIWDGLHVDQHNDSLQCQWMLLGYLDQNLFLQGLKPLPNPPFSGFSLNDLGKAFNDFNFTNECPCLLENHIEELRVKVLSCVDKTMNGSKNGLDLQQFLAKEPTQNISDGNIIYKP